MSLVSLVVGDGAASFFHVCVVVIGGGVAVEAVDSGAGHVSVVSIVSTVGLFVVGVGVGVGVESQL